MAKFDRISSFFWIGMAIAICVESIRLGPGSLSAPGPGLIALGCGMSLGILGLILFARTFKSGAKRREVVWEQGILWKKLVFALASLIGYAFSLDILGFRLVTLLWMGFICRFGKIGWKMTVFISIITTLSCYILFTYLGIRFPHGVLGF